MTKPAKNRLGMVFINPKHVPNCLKEHVHCFRSQVLELTLVARQENLIQVLQAATDKASEDIAVDMHTVLDLGDCIKVAVPAGQGGTDDLIPKAYVEQKSKKVPLLRTKAQEPVD